MTPTIITAIGLLVVVAALYRFVFWKRKEPKTGWSIGPIFEGKNYSINMPAVPTPLPGGVWTVTIKPGGELDGITMPRGPISGAIKLRYRVTGSGLTPTDAEGAGTEAILTPYIEKAGDNGFIATNRWYLAKPLPLTDGEHEATVPLEPAPWVDMEGAGASDFAKEFAATLADGGRIGLGFGWWGGRMHGVRTASAVTFDLLGWEVG